MRTSRNFTLPVLLTAGAVVACSSAPEGGAASAGPTVGEDVTPLSMGVLPAGTYRTTRFEPTLVLTLDDGWRQLFADEDDEVALEHGAERIALNLTRVARVVDPATGSAIDAPDDLVAWIVSHPALSAGTPEPVMVAGRDAQTLTIGPGTSEVPLFAYPEGNMRLPPGTQARIYVVPLEGPDLTVFVAGPADDAAAATERVASILDSLQLLPGD